MIETAKQWGRAALTYAGNLVKSLMERIDPFTLAVWISAITLAVVLVVLV